MATAPKHLPPAEEEIYYPETDGKPMGETEYHVAAILYLYGALDLYLQKRKMHVAADLFLYYEQGNPRAVKAPDVMVIKGLDKAFRRTFKTWKEKAVPCVVFEVTSASTIDEDLGGKRDLYARLGVAEYFIFDPEEEALDPPLEGYRLKEKQYVPIKPGRDGSLLSKELGLRVRAEGYLPRLSDAKTGQPLPTTKEIHEQERQRAEQAEQERQRAEQQRQRAEQAEQRAEQAEAEATRLREELDRLKRGK
jgi:Uma2 family endonuclease